MNADHTQEGVMDSLFEALHTGSAFSRDQRRRRQGTSNTTGNMFLLIFYKSLFSIISNINFVCIFSAPLLYRSRSRNAFNERDLPTTRVQH